MGPSNTENQRQLFREVDEYINSRFDVWVACRRHLHANPELSWQETATTVYIKQQLENLGLTMEPGPRGMGGFVNLSSAGANGRLIAYRGDIDAIPVEEETGREFCSRVPGVMHACGHDVHTTVALGVCDTVQQLLRRGLPTFPVNLRVLFQPAEEVAQGASEMIALGALDGVESIMAMHVDASREVGCVGFRDGVQTACSEVIRVCFHGEGGHSARPHETADPLFAAAQFINTAYSSVPRITDSRVPEVLTFCHIAGGQYPNVIPSDVTLRGTLRTFDEAARQQILRHLKQIGEATGQVTGVQVSIEPGDHSPSVINDPHTNQLLRAAAESFLKPDSITEVEPSLGGEDFSFYQQRVPGSLLRVGSSGGDYGRAHLHSPHFDVDEDVIRVAVALFTRSILKWAAASP
ncbi:MAG: amidohydrolase [Pirellulaceae bacterium]|nr:amidohydrolase [Pirellulaceae bacterium]